MTRVRNRYPRIPCLVPGCGCGATCYPPGCEIICPKHYRIVDRWLKARRRRLRAAYKRRGEYESLRSETALGHCWRQMRRQAIERGAGL